MEQSGTDRRVRKTKSQLRLALMELLVEKSAKNISVRELAERADINRGTFYIHYRDGGDLLQRLEDEMADRLAGLCKSHRPEDSAPGQFPFLRDLYRFIRDNADLCRVLLGPMGTLPIPTASAAFCGTTFFLISCLCSIRETGSGSTASVRLSCQAT